MDGSKLPNLICVLPGRSQKVIIVGAHYDHPEEGGDGVVDNWSGASLLPSLYRSVKFDPRQHSYIFIGFAAEERAKSGRVLCPTNDRGTGCGHGCDGEHGRAWTGAG